MRFRRTHEPRIDADTSPPADPGMEGLYSVMRALGIGSVLRSVASMDETDDGDEEAFELLKLLGPQLKENWDKRSAEYKAELAALQLKPGQPGYAEQE